MTFNLGYAFGDSKQRFASLTFKPQITTLWDFQKCDPRFGFKYPGRIPGQIVMNLLYYYTKEGDVILDPMAGSGTTIDVCKAMNRKCVAFDINPSREDIRQNDITDGIPLKDNSVDFVFLDPPYGDWKKGEYTQNETDLSQMTVLRYLKNIEFISKEIHRVLKRGGKLGFLILELYSKKRYADLGFECYKILEKDFKPIQRIYVPARGFSGFNKVWISRALKFKFMLRGCRDLLVMEKI